MKPTVAVVILTWNGRELTLDCLQSLSSLDYPNFQVIVVDNGSSDGTVSSIRSEYPSATVIANEKNLGFANGNNIGLQHALEREVDYILFLNNDTLVEPTMLRRLVEFAEAKPEVGMVGPSMYCFDPSDTLFAAGSFVDWSNGTIRHRGMFQSSASLEHRYEPEPVDFICGCGFLASRRMIEEVGGFNPSYYLNFEDVELGERAKRSGFEVWFMPRAKMWHRVSATLGRGSPANTYYMIRNSLHFFWSNSPGRLRFVSTSRILGRALRSWAAWSLKPEYRTEEFRAKGRANLFAIRDFLRGNMGQMGQDVARACGLDGAL